MTKLTLSNRAASRQNQAYLAGQKALPVTLDNWVLLPALLLLSVGIVMVGSASIAVAEGQGASSYHYLLFMIRGGEF